MTREEARRKAEEACERSPFVHEQILSVLEAFGLIKIEGDSNANEVEGTEQSDARCGVG